MCSRNRVLHQLQRLNTYAEQAAHIKSILGCFTAKFKQGLKVWAMLLGAQRNFSYKRRLRGSYNSLDVWTTVGLSSSTLVS